MPAGLEPAAFTPLMQGRVDDAQLTLQVRQPPLVLVQGRPSSPMRLMHLQAPHQFHHRLSAEGLRLFGSVEALWRQTGRDLDGAIPSLRERLNTLTEQGIIA